MKVTMQMLVDIQKDIAVLTKLVSEHTNTPINLRCESYSKDLKKYKKALQGARATRKYLEDQIC